MTRRRRYITDMEVKTVGNRKGFQDHLGLLHRITSEKWGTASLESGRDNGLYKKCFVDGAKYSNICVFHIPRARALIISHNSFCDFLPPAQHASGNICINTLSHQTGVIFVQLYSKSTKQVVWKKLCLRLARAKFTAWTVGITDSRRIVD